MRLVNIVTRRHTKRILYQKTQTQRALRSSGLFWTATAKAVIVNCRPPDYTARGGLHIADGAEPWCGPARRPANPCVARTSGAPSRALFHSPVPGPVHVPPDIRPMCFGAPDFSVAAPMPMVPSRAGVPIEHAGWVQLPLTSRRTAFTDNPPRPHLTSESWSSLLDWAARASPLTARRVVLAPPSCHAAGCSGNGASASVVRFR